MVFFPFILDAIGLAEDFDNLRSRARSFSSFFLKKQCGASSSKATSSSSWTPDDSSSLMSGSFPETGRSLMCWLRIRILEATPVLSVDPNHRYNAEIAVSTIVCQIPPNHENYKLQTTLLGLGPLMQILGACFAYHVWHRSFILVTNFNTKISMVACFINLWLDSCFEQWQDLPTGAISFTCEIKKNTK